jgi:hypothetical protein
MVIFNKCCVLLLQVGQLLVLVPVHVLQLHDVARHEDAEEERKHHHWRYHVQELPACSSKTVGSSSDEWMDDWMDGKLVEGATGPQARPLPCICGNSVLFEQFNDIQLELVAQASSSSSSSPASLRLVCRGLVALMVLADFIAIELSR